MNSFLGGDNYLEFTKYITKNIGLHLFWKLIFFDIGYALILGIRKKNRKKLCIKNWRYYKLLIGSISRLLNEIILMNLNCKLINK